MFLSNNPSSGDINLSNLSCLGTVFYQYSTETSKFWRLGVNKNDCFCCGLLCSTQFLARY